MLTDQLNSRLLGCLTGAVIGAELSYARIMEWPKVTPLELLDHPLRPSLKLVEEPGRCNIRPVTALTALGVKAYLAAGGRATPEDFADVLRVDAGIAAPAFWWDGLHTTQEVLKEGMPPRISGLGNAPCGLLGAAMPAVGIYHFGHPEYAYLDGVELASVNQPRMGADWAALCAAAVAAALAAEATPHDVVGTVLRIAFANNKELFYHLNRPIKEAQYQAENTSCQDFAAWWITATERHELVQHNTWFENNPLRFVLPVLSRSATDVQQFMRFLLMASYPMGNGSVAAAIGGALAGALYGEDAFPAEWRAWAEPQTAAWHPLFDLLEKRLGQEREIIRLTEGLNTPRGEDGTLLRDKIYGCLLAGAIGNAMGSPVECQMYWEIDVKHPDGITTILDPKRLESEDDNQMAMLLVETYLERAGLPVMARHFGETWRERLNRDHFFPFCMGNAYDLIRQGWDPRITGQWSVVTGSTVMCMEPVGLYHLADPGFAAIDARAISYMYQRGLDVDAAVMLAATVAEALRPDATVDSVLHAALEVAPRTKARSFDERSYASPYDYISTCLEIAEKYDDVLAVRKELYDRCLLYSMIDPLELWGFALAMFKIANGDVRQAAIGGTNIGRDSDTIAGRAAMLTGTLCGASSVPEEWKRLFLPASLARIARNTERIVDLLTGKKLDPLRQRQQALVAAPV
ncbi:MAG: ADP-ribosylglycohydrolase family protein [Armatimonadota bacterium]